MRFCQKGGVSGMFRAILILWENASCVSSRNAPRNRFQRKENWYGAFDTFGWKGKTSSL